MTTIRKRVAILAGALLMLGATTPVCAHAQSDQQQQQQQQDKKHPPAKREQQPVQQERTQQRDQQRQEQQAQKQQEQQQKQQRKMEKQQAKQQQQEQKRVQKQQQQQEKEQRAQRPRQEQQRNNQRPQRGQEQQAQGRTQGRGNRGDPQQIAHYEQAHMRQYRPHGHEREVRIPDPQYHQYFGEEHRFHISQRVVVDGFPRFQYEGFWFVLEEPWPEYWYDTDDFYVVYTDDGYFLYDYDDPGVVVELVVVTDED
ncbi:MAG TPA: hypothetical protein VKS20_15815 [Candidatus Acidoferrales bacterium]|nr:hypothetical protein [Candidatus Acidoferrales bacterium]